MDYIRPTKIEKQTINRTGWLLMIKLPWAILPTGNFSDSSDSEHPFTVR
jgi:hypothetical protein